MIRLVAFLGNTGREYEDTRHNTAWLFSRFLFDDCESSSICWHKKHNSQLASPQRSELLSLLGNTSSPSASSDDKLLLQKPLTLMNRSGQAVSHTAAFYKVKAEDILVVHDEIELALGTVSLKFSGGLAGHNGLRSVKAQLGTADFWRLRFGVGKPASGDVAGYVLSAFTADERITLERVFGCAGELFATLIASATPQNLLPRWAKVKVE